MTGFVVRAPAVALAGIAKKFGSFVALRDVTLGRTDLPVRMMQATET